MSQRILFRTLDGMWIIRSTKHADKTQQIAVAPGDGKEDQRNTHFFPSVSEAKRYLHLTLGYAPEQMVTADSE